MPDQSPPAPKGRVMPDSAFPVFHRQAPGTTYTDGSAVPDDGEHWYHIDMGMSLRDYFAASALPAICTDVWLRPMWARKASSAEIAQSVAEASYIFADAMVEARKKGGAA